jgi:hypothetical protein
MNDLELSHIKIELTRLFEEQVEFFRKRSLGSLVPSSTTSTRKDASASGSCLPN